MDWQLRLRTPYDFVCKLYEEQLWAYCQRFSPHVDLTFSDEDVLCIYLWGFLEKRRELRSIYDDTRRHLSEWFPRLPCVRGLCTTVESARGGVCTVTGSIAGGWPSDGGIGWLIRDD